MLGRRAVRDDAPEVEHVDVVAHLHDERHVVLDEQHRQAVVLGELTQEPTEGLGLVLGLARRGLVEQQHASAGS